MTSGGAGHNPPGLLVLAVLVLPDDVKVAAELVEVHVTDGTSGIGLPFTSVYTAVSCNTCGLVRALASSAPTRSVLAQNRATIE